MSALAPIATAKADFLKNHVCFNRKRTCAAHAPMSAKGQYRTNAKGQAMRLMRVGNCSEKRRKRRELHALFLHCVSSLPRSVKNIGRLSNSLPAGSSVNFE